VLRVSISESPRDVVTVNLEGSLAGFWVAEVRAACTPLFSRRRRLVLDLAGVEFADPEGLSLLRELIGRQFTVINASPFLNLQLLKDSSKTSTEA
jgi:hypothetical protein